MTMTIKKQILSVNFKAKRDSSSSRRRSSSSSSSSRSRKSHTVPDVLQLIRTIRRLGAGLIKKIEFNGDVRRRPALTF